MKSFIVQYNGKFIRVYKQSVVDRLITTKFKEPTSNMFEIEIKGRSYIFNKTNITYILLGDGSVPSDTAMRVTIVFDGDMKQFYFNDHESALKLYNKLKQLIFPAEELSLSEIP